MVLFKCFKKRTVTIIEREGDSQEKGTTLDVGTAFIGNSSLHLPRSSSDAQYFLSQWSRVSSCKLTNLGFNENNENVSISEALILDSALHKKADKPEQFAVLGHKVHTNEVEWANALKVSAELSYTEGYFEWTEDILGRHNNFLKKEITLFDAIFASLFSYDRHGPVLKAFLESWCPLTNTLHCSVGELSISLRDLRVLGGLPFGGKFYDEVVPDAVELSTVREDGTLLLPFSCRYLFLAFHRLCKKCKVDRAVKISDWVDYWFKGAIRHKKIPPRRVARNKTQRPKETYNPSGVIPPPKALSAREDDVLNSLGVEQEVKEKTHLAAFLACWLCKFVLPANPSNMIRPGVFKVASMMAEGEKFCLSVPVLASIYRGLNDMISSPEPGNFNAVFPIHYVYGWMAEYFKTHFFAPNSNFSPRMTIYSGEGSAMHFEESEAQDLFRFCKGVDLSRLSKQFPQRKLLIDDGNLSLSDFECMATLRSSYLTLRHGNRFIIEPYSPHRFSRQFGYHQDVPGKLKEDVRNGTLEVISKYWKLSTRFRTQSKMLVPSKSSFQKFSVTENYVKWWSRVHIDPFAEKRASSGQIKRAISTEKQPAKVRKVIISGPKSNFPSTPAPRDESSGNCLEVTKQLLPPVKTHPRRQLVVDSDEDKEDDNEDRNWKHVGDKTEDVITRDPIVVHHNMEHLFDGVPSSSQPIQTKGNEGFLGEDLVFVTDPFCREESVDGPFSWDLASRRRNSAIILDEANHPVQNVMFYERQSQPLALSMEQEVPSHPPQRVGETFEVNVESLAEKQPLENIQSLHQVAPSEAITLDAKGVISEAKRMAATLFEGKIKNAIANTPLSKIPSLRPKLEELFHGLSLFSVDCSKFRERIETYLQSAEKYNQIQSEYAYTLTEETRVQRLNDVDSRLSEVLALDNADIECVQSLQEGLINDEKEIECLRGRIVERKASIEEINARMLQRKCGITSLQEERKAVDEAPIITDADKKAMSNLERLLKKEQDEIQKQSWLS